MKYISEVTSTTSSGREVTAVIHQSPVTNQYRVVFENIAPFIEANGWFASEDEAYRFARRVVNEYTERFEVLEAEEKALNDDASDNAEIEIDAPAQPEPAPEVMYIDPVTTADGETITAWVTRLPDGDYFIEVLANGKAIMGECDTIYGRKAALAHANAMVAIYVIKANRARAIEMGDETETAPSEVTPLERRFARKAYLRQQIERTESELASLRFELSELE